MAPEEPFLCQTVSQCLGLILFRFAQCGMVHPGVCGRVKNGSSKFCMVFEVSVSNQSMVTRLQSKGVARATAE